MTIIELQEALNKINEQAKKICKETGYETYGELSNVEFDPKNPEHAFLMDELYSAVHKLDQVSWGLDYLNRPVRYEGVLTLNSRDRYELCGIELTCGSGLEILYYDELFERYTWIASSIEHNGKEYYFVAKPNIELEGVTARIRK